MTNPRVVRAIVAVLFSISAASTYARSSDPSAPGAVGGLSVSSDPAGAVVYLDGKLAGETPFTSDGVVAGDHRVKVVKDGYLENARIVSVIAGKPSDLSVKLTRDQSGSGSTPKPATPPAKGGGSNKWLWIGLAGGGAAAAVILATRGGGHPPVVQTPTASATTQLVGMTVNFGVVATDADNDPLTYAWDFGDGGTATSGAAPSHAYAAAGTFIAKVVVDDGHGHKVTSDPVNVTTKSFAGTWRGSINLQPGTLAVTMILTQNIASISGPYTDSFSTGNANGGFIPANSAITLTITSSGFQPWVFTGTLSADLNTYSGVVNQSGFANNPFTLTRQ